MVTEYQFSPVDETAHKFLFVSQGVKSSALKLVLFRKVPDEDGVYSISFVDLDPETGIPYPDVLYTGNHDAIRVFKTIALIAISFSERQKVNGFTISGSDEKRNRVYGLLILRYMKLVGTLFEVYCVVGDVRNPYVEVSQNCEAYFFQNLAYQ